MGTKYFVKFIGDKHVTVAIAHNTEEEKTLVRNQFEPTTEEFYYWVRMNTQPLERTTAR